MEHAGFIYNFLRYNTVMCLRVKGVPKSRASWLVTVVHYIGDGILV